LETLASQSLEIFKRRRRIIQDIDQNLQI